MVKINKVLAEKIHLTVAKIMEVNSPFDKEKIINLLTEIKVGKQTFSLSKETVENYLCNFLQNNLLELNDSKYSVTDLYYCDSYSEE